MKQLFMRLSVRFLAIAAAVRTHLEIDRHPTGRLAAFLVVLAAAVAFVPTAQGQTEVTLGGNLDQSEAGTVAVAAGTQLAVLLVAPERGEVTLTALTLDIPTHGGG